MAVSRKDFDAVAAVIKTQIDSQNTRETWANERGYDEVAGKAISARQAIIDTANDLCCTFEQLNPNFARRRFLIAAGVIVKTTGWADAQL